MMKILLVVGIFLNSCVYTRVNEYFDNPVVGKKTQRDYKDPVEEGLFDPDSSRYRKIKFYTPRRGSKKITVMCGTHNAKNRMGGYVGYTRFVSDTVRADSDTWMKKSNSISDNKVIDCLCTNGNVSNKCGSSSFCPWSWFFVVYGGGWLWAKC